MEMLVVMLPAIGGGLALLALTWSALGPGILLFAPALVSAAALLAFLLLAFLWSRQLSGNVPLVRAPDASIPDQVASNSSLPQHRAS